MITVLIHNLQFIIMITTITDVIHQMVVGRY